MVVPPSGPLAFVGGSGATAGNFKAVFSEFAGAGFTHSWAVFDNPRHGRLLLDGAQAAGIRLMARPGASKWPIEEVARRFKNHPALAGFMLQDEPSAAEFPALAGTAWSLLAEDSSKTVLVNLYPDGATGEQLGIKPHQEYRDYLYKFLSEVPVNLLSYDCYPIKRFGVLPGWYGNLEVIRQAAQSAKLPLWVWIASVGMDLTPDPTMGSFRLQAYTNLAYGATGIEHFCYHTHKGLGMRMGCIERDGSRTPTYDLVKQLHRELGAQAGVFVGSTLRRVGYAGSSVPKSTRPYEPLEPITALKAGGKGAVVAEFSKDTYRFLVIVNQDYLEPMPLAVRWKPPTVLGSVQKDGGVTILARPGLEANVDPGDAVILAWRAETE